MADVSIAWRLTNKSTALSDELGQPDTGDAANHIGDIISIMSSGHDWSSHERTIFGIAIITDIPDEKLATINRKFVEEGWIGKIVETLSGGWVVVSDFGSRMRRPRRFKVDKALCIAQWPALESKIELLFDPTFTVPTDQIPVLPWTKFKHVFVDKTTTSATTSDEMEADPGAEPS
jgi:hypothetical protein